MNAIVKELEHLNSIQELIRQLQTKINEFSIFVFDNKVADKDLHLHLLNHVDQMDLLIENCKFELETENEK